MNLFLTLVFAVCCAASEYSLPVWVDDWSVRLVAIMVLTLIAPLAAVLQTRWVAGRLVRSKASYDIQSLIVRRLSQAHCLIWAISSLLIFLMFGWSSMVGELRGLFRLPIVYEILLLSPLLVSLVGSWLAFFDIQQFYGRPKSEWSLNWSKRWSFASVRIRVHLVTMLVPLIIVFTGIRFAGSLSQFSMAQIVLGGAIAGLWGSAMIPYLFMMIWDTGEIADAKQSQRLHDVFRKSNVAVTQIRVWKTGHQIANAAVAGFLPGFRMVVLTDTLMQYFSGGEIAAIVRHEAGHIKLMHLPLKMFFVLLPMVALIADQTHHFGIHHGMSLLLDQGGVPEALVPEMVQAMIAVCFIVYLFFVLRWLNHRLEHEADLFAAVGDSPDECCPSQDTQAALSKLALISPHPVDRSTFLHPSIENRIALLSSVQQDESLSIEFQRSFRRRNVVITLPWVVLLVLAVFG